MFVAAAVAGAIALIPALLATLRGSPLERLVALQVVSCGVALIFAMLAGEGRTSFDLDLAIAVALLSFTGALTLVRFSGSWA